MTGRLIAAALLALGIFGFHRPTTSVVGLRGDGVTDDTAAIMAAYNAVPEGGVLRIPAAAKCFRVTQLVFTRDVSIEGEGYSVDSWGMHFGEGGFVQHFHGSVLCSTVTSGKAVVFRTGASGLELTRFAVVGPGSGTSTGVAFGDDDAGQYWQQNTVLNVTVGNFANPVLVYGQNNVFDALKVDGAAPKGARPEGVGVYLAATAGGTSNANHFAGLVIAGGNHVNLYAQGQSNDFSGLDLENPAPNDPTAVSLYSYNCNECTFTSGYIESAGGQTYTGEAILVDGPSTRANSIGATFINQHISGGPTSIHIARAYHTTVLGGQMGRVVVDASPTNLYTVDLDALEDKTTRASVVSEK